MTELIRVDFKSKKLIGRHQLGELANVPTNYRCICCGNSYTNDTASGAYCKAVSWTVGNKNKSTVHLCQHCIAQMYDVIKGEE